MSDKLKYGFGAQPKLSQIGRYKHSKFAPVHDLIDELKPDGEWLHIDQLDKEEYLILQRVIHSRLRRHTGFKLITRKEPADDGTLTMWIHKVGFGGNGNGGK